MITSLVSSGVVVARASARVAVAIPATVIAPVRMVAITAGRASIAAIFLGQHIAKQAASGCTPYCEQGVTVCQDGSRCGSQAGTQKGVVVSATLSRASSECQHDQADCCNTGQASSPVTHNESPVHQWYEISVVG